MSKFIKKYFNAIKQGKFNDWAEYCKIKNGKDQSQMMFKYEKWSNEQKSYYKNSKAGNRAQRGEKFKPRYDVVVKSRRIGMTTFACLQDLFFAIKFPGRDVMFVAQDESTRIEGLEIIRSAHTVLKEFSDKLGVKLVPEMDTDNVRTIKLSNGSRILSEVAKANAVAANKAGRGRTISRLHCTEVAFWSHPAETMLSLLEAASNAMEIVIESTPNGASGYFYELVQKSQPYKERGVDTKWRLHFFPWQNHSDYKSKLGFEFNPESKNKWEETLRKKHKITDEQLAWWREKVLDHGLSNVLQEYPSDMVSCFRGTGTTFLSNLDMDWLSENHRPPEIIEEHNNIVLSIWDLPLDNKSANYIIGVDAGYGRGQDFTAMYVLNSNTGEIVASAASNDISTDIWATFLNYVGRWYNNAMIVVEQLSAGHSVISDLMVTHKYVNMFKHSDKEYFGWNTTSTSRTIMFYNIQSAIHDKVNTIPCQKLINEFKSIVLGDDGKKPQAKTGMHDDRVMAYGIALSVWKLMPAFTSTGYVSLRKVDAYNMNSGKIQRASSNKKGFL